MRKFPRIKFVYSAEEKAGMEKAAALRGPVSGQEQQKSI
jgi:hypothetical protein